VLHQAKHADSRTNTALLLETVSCGSSTTMTALSGHERADYQA
jgi:hypothetical protein